MLPVRKKQASLPSRYLPGERKNYYLCARILRVASYCHHISIEVDMETNDQYEELCRSVAAFRQTLEGLQADYRKRKGEPEYTVISEDGKTLPFSTLLAGGEGSGANFLLRQTFNYAKERICTKKQDEHIDSFLLFNDLLSETAMAFNLFFPLMLMQNEDPRSVTQVLCNALGNFSINAITEIGVEYVPDLAGKYIGAHTALNAYILWTDRRGGKRITAITLKYADPLSLEESGNTEMQKKLLVGSDLFIPGFGQAAGEGSVRITRLYRNFLLAERYREVNGLSDSRTVLLAPRAHPTTAAEIDSVRPWLKDEMQYKLRAITLENFVESLILYSPDFYKDAFQLFKERYLNIPG